MKAFCPDCNKVVNSTYPEEDCFSCKCKECGYIIAEKNDQVDIRNNILYNKKYNSIDRAFVDFLFTTGYVYQDNDIIEMIRTAYYSGAGLE